MLKFIKKLNDKIALKTTLWMSTMWCVWLFLFWAILPAIYKPSTDIVFYISSAVIQLVALPLIMVGQNLLSKSAENRAKKDHQILMQEVKDIKEILTRLEKIEQKIELIKKD